MGKLAWFIVWIDLVLIFIIEWHRYKVSQIDKYVSKFVEERDPLKMIGILYEVPCWWRKEIVMRAYIILKSRGDCDGSNSN